MKPAFGQDARISKQCGNQMIWISRVYIFAAQDCASKDGDPLLDHPSDGEVLHGKWGGLGMKRCHRTAMVSIDRYKEVHGLLAAYFA